LHILEEYQGRYRAIVCLDRIMPPRVFLLERDWQKAKEAKHTKQVMPVISVTSSAKIENVEVPVIISAKAK